MNQNNMEYKLQHLLALDEQMLRDESMIPSTEMKMAHVENN